MYLLTLRQCTHSMIVWSCVFDQIHCCLWIRPVLINTVSNVNLLIAFPRQPGGVWEKTRSDNAWGSTLAFFRIWCGFCGCLRINPNRWWPWIWGGYCAFSPCFLALPLLPQLQFLHLSPCYRRTRTFYPGCGPAICLELAHSYTIWPTGFFQNDCLLDYITGELRGAVWFPRL